MADEAPVMTSEMKLNVLIAHREYIKADAESRIAELNKQKALQVLTDTVDRVGIELGVEKSKYTVNLDALVLTPVK
jgi:hypothetical protein